MANTIIVNGRRVASDRIDELGENEIFVFGSNIYGAHSGGAAWYAHKKFGAEWGVGANYYLQKRGMLLYPFHMDSVLYYFVYQPQT